MGWTTRDKKIHRDDVTRTVVNLRITNKRAASNGACADGDHDLRSGHCVISFLQCEFHIFRHWASDEQSIGVARRSDELDPKSSQVPTNGSEHIGVRFASGAAAGAHLPETKRTTEELPKLVIQCSGETQLLFASVGEDKVFATTHRHPVVTRLSDGFGRARFDASGAKDATAEVQGNGFAG